MMEDLKLLVGNDEQIMYEGKPNKKCFILEGIFNPMLPFAIIWAVLDFSVIGLVLKNNIPDSAFLTLLSFLVIHLLPVWIYLGGALFTFVRYKNTAYIVTDRAIYVSQGVFRKSLLRKSFGELSHIQLHRGIFDQMFKVGDIIATSNQRDANNKTAALTIASISDYQEVYQMVKKLQADVYTDIMYPNALRPDENPGYKTKYKGE